jgi:hypothetical protein
MRSNHHLYLDFKGRGRYPNSVLPPVGLPAFVLAAGSEVFCFDYRTTFFRVALSPENCKARADFGMREGERCRAMSNTVFGAAEAGLAKRAPRLIGRGKGRVSG